LPRDDRVPARQTARRRYRAYENQVVPGHDRDTIRRADGRSGEGEVHFLLQRFAGGLYVEREEIPRHGTRTIQSLVFDDRRSFEQWCGDDPIRFAQPLLHAQLKRDGEALWRLDG
jgi:hypothetical protein